MASLDVNKIAAPRTASMLAGLSNPAHAIGGPWMDALLFWGVPVLSLLCVNLWLGAAAGLPQASADTAIKYLSVFSIVITFAHLVAVVPRAYLNRDVYSAYKLRLTLVPLLLVAGLLLSSTLLAVAAVVAMFWDVHHSAMQNFGLGRIYDSKIGNDPHQLRRADLRLNWVLYVGPLAAGPALMTHLHALDDLNVTALHSLAQLPGIFEGHLSAISLAAMLVWTSVIGVTVHDYSKAMQAGYRLPAHKAVLICTTGGVSLLAWGFSSPAVAFISINIYHALQYFALVWLKEGKRMAAVPRISARKTLLIFCFACGMFGIAYMMAKDSSITWLVAPFLACSLLHFWYDGFVWSVRKRQV
jgi:hypothetical protein